MTDDTGLEKDGPAGVTGRLAADWATIWRSEMSACALDPEPAQMAAAWVALWQAGLAAATTLLPPMPMPMPGPADGASGCAGPQSPPRAAAADVASDDGGAAGTSIENLVRRLAELERRLDSLAGLGVGAEPAG